MNAAYFKFAFSLLFDLLISLGDAYKLTFRSFIPSHHLFMHWVLTYSLCQWMVWWTSVFLTLWGIKLWPYAEENNQIILVYPISQNIECKSPSTGIGFIYIYIYIKYLYIWIYISICTYRKIHICVYCIVLVYIHKYSAVCIYFTLNNEGMSTEQKIGIHFIITIDGSEPKS